MGFEALGFPHRSTILRVAVSMPARSLVVQVQVQTDPDPSGRLFARRFDERRYHALVPHEEGHNIQDPTPSPTTPHVYFNRFLHSYCDGSWGGNWDGLYKVDCESRAVECLLSRSMDFISKILGISGDGTSLYVVGSSTTSGTESSSRTDRAGPTSRSCRIDYGVAELDLATLKMRPLTALRAMFV